MTLQNKLDELGISLPDTAPAAGLFAPYVRSGSLVFLSGQLAKRSDGTIFRGRLGESVTLEEAQACARGIAIDLLGTLRHACDGELARVRRVVKLLGLVNSTPEFTDHHLVINGCSALLNELFGSTNGHARSAIGVAQLPLGACVEIELIAEVDE